MKETITTMHNLFFETFSYLDKYEKLNKNIVHCKDTIKLINKSEDKGKIRMNN